MQVFGSRVRRFLPENVVPVSLAIGTAAAALTFILKLLFPQFIHTSGIGIVFFAFIFAIAGIPYLRARTEEAKRIRGQGGADSDNRHDNC
jgi:hypothetical protein